MTVTSNKIYNNLNPSGEANPSVFSLFLKYVSANVLGMIGYSCYILADTFFIARGIGSDALAALNLVLPAYSLMNGTGLMIGMGAASRYTISSTKPDGTLHRTIFTQALYVMAFAAVIFSSSGILFPYKIAAVLGADADTIGYAADYIRILLMFSPLFLGNNLLRSERVHCQNRIGITVSYYGYIGGEQYGFYPPSENEHSLRLPDNLRNLKAVSS